MFMISGGDCQQEKVFWTAVASEARHRFDFKMAN
jgi:hypothetical protein